MRDEDKPFVMYRKGPMNFTIVPRGRADLLTRIGRDTIAHCSTLTYDFEREEIRLTCAPFPGNGVGALRGEIGFGFDQAAGATDPPS
jgi:hypothetical protein